MELSKIAKITVDIKNIIKDSDISAHTKIDIYEKLIEINEEIIKHRVICNCNNKDKE